MYVCVILSLYSRKVCSALNIYKTLLLLALWKRKNIQKRLGRKEWKGTSVSVLWNHKALLSCWKEKKKKALFILVNHN